MPKTPSLAGGRATHLPAPGRVYDDKLDLHTRTGCRRRAIAVPLPGTPPQRSTWGGKVRFGSKLTHGPVGAWGEGPFWPKIDLGSRGGPGGEGPFWPKIDPGDAKQFRTSETSETTILSPMFLMFKNPFALHQFICYLPFRFVDLLTC